MSPAETLYNEVKQSIKEILDGVTDEEKEDILTALEKDTDDTVLTFDIAEIMENL